jgi:hypothetical protein
MEKCLNKMHNKLEKELLTKDTCAPKIFRYSKSTNTLYVIVEEESENIF